MKIKQKTLLVSFLAVAFSTVGVIAHVNPAYAESLSYNLACQDGTWELSQAKQPAKHQVVVRCKSGAKFTYMNNESDAKSQVTGRCPSGEQVGSDVDVPNGKSSKLTLYCVKGTAEHMTRTNNTPSVSTKKIAPPDSDNPDGDSDTDACNVKTSIIQVDCSTGGNPIWGLLLMAINILTAGIGIVAIGGVIYAAILWTTAEDKNAQIVKSKETIFNVVVGLVAFALLYAFLQFLIPGGIFNVGP